MKKITSVLLAVILAAGVSLMLYPGVSEYWNKLHQTHAVMSYTENVELMEKAAYERILEAAYEYNHNLAEKGSDWNIDEEERTVYRKQLNIDDSGIMGYVTIPKIHVVLPICYGTDEDVLQTAVGHLEATSLPVGCESFSQKTGKVKDQTEGSHCALSGHRGLPSAKLFTDLDRMAEGDRFSINVLDETLTYEVDQIRIVEPENLSDLQIVPGEDYCTLITCTPYGINTHRLLIRGRRVVSTPDDRITQSAASRFWPGLIILTGVVPGLIILGVVTRRRKPTRPI